MELPTATSVFALNVHAGYACAHSGACCSSGWPIPVERDTYARLGELIGGGRLFLGRPGHEREAADVLFEHSGAPDDTPAVVAVDCDGGCAFYERDTRRCAIHRQVGHELLPLACQQFPRVSLLDGRGLFVSLSHYCPTAANALLRDEPPLVVESPDVFPVDFGYDPLDAREALPPLLHPSVLLDLRTFDAWEHEAIWLLGNSGDTPEQALGAVAVLTESLRTWKPGKQDVQQALEEASRAGRTTRVQPADGASGIRSFISDYCLVLEAVPEALRPDAPATRRLDVPRWADFAMPARRYLAAKLFGSWLGYQGRGLRTIVFSLGVALSVLKLHAADECDRRGGGLDPDGFIAAVRRTDELLVHLAGRQALADLLGRAEAWTMERALGAVGCRLA